MNDRLDAAPPVLVGCADRTDQAFREQDSCRFHLYVAAELAKEAGELIGYPLAPESPSGGLRRVAWSVAV